jgi:1-pyrroline-5-carboxylate dehydrogenase
MPQEARAAIFLRAAEMLATKYRPILNAATMLGQSKTCHQAEIDAACELIDFLRFNCAFAERMLAEQPVSGAGVWNQTDWRPLEGFVLAVTPFNFTSIAANLPCAPALLGNAVVWKPAVTATLSAHWIMRLLGEAGLPPGVINMVLGDPAELVGEALASEHLAGVHFTGSTAVFRGLSQRVAEGLGRYRNLPRVVGETGGKDFIFAHPSADLDALAVAVVRGGYEYQGQKCSAASRVFVPRSLHRPLLERCLGMLSEVRTGDVTDFGNFLGAVIDERAWQRITGYVSRARGSADCTVLAGDAHRERGWFITPTLVEVRDPDHELLREELFGPVVALFPYADDRYEEALGLCDRGSPYALTGAFFARDRRALAHGARALRFAAGNFYLNDKPTGAVVGQQPFGGARASGTNDKAGSMLNLLQWVSPRTIKETFAPPTDWRYPFLG